MLPRPLWIVAVTLFAGTVRADLITPDSISPIPTDFVTNQYQGLGLVFPTPSDAWPIGTYYGYGGWQFAMLNWERNPSGVPIGPPIPDIQSGFQRAGFVMPGTGVPALTASLRVLVNSPYDTVFTLTGYDLAGRSIVSRDMLVSAYTDSWLTFRAAGMHSFDISSMYAPSVPPPWYNQPDFVMKAIEFHPVAALPEPGGFALSGLGTLILILIQVWRRSRTWHVLNCSETMTLRRPLARLVPFSQAPKVRRFSTIFGACQSGSGFWKDHRKGGVVNNPKTPIFPDFPPRRTSEKGHKSRLEPLTKWRAARRKPAGKAPPAGLRRAARP